MRLVKSCDIRSSNRQTPAILAQSRQNVIAWRPLPIPPLPITIAASRFPPGWPPIRYRYITATVAPPQANITIAPGSPTATITAAVASELRDCCADLALRDDVAVAIITGAGDANANARPIFATGRANPPDDIRQAPMPQRIAALDDLAVADAVAALPMPVIAKLNGDAIAHGLELALAADLRVASDTARLGCGGLDESPFPFDGATQRLPRLIGPAWARDLLLTGRQLTANEALDIGLVNRVVSAGQLDDAVDDLAAGITAAAPIASRYAKEAVHAGADLTLQQGLRLEADLSILLHSTADRAEGLRAFHEKRPPLFTGR